MADPEYVRMVAPQFESRKKAANWCVHLRGSVQINALLQTVELYCGCLGHFLEYPFPGKVGYDLDEEKNVLPRSDGPLSSSELGEYPNPT